jgi:hypothetical protein
MIDVDYRMAGFGHFLIDPRGFLLFLTLSQRRQEPRLSAETGQCPMMPCHRIGLSVKNIAVYTMK